MIKYKKDSVKRELRFAALYGRVGKGESLYVRLEELEQEYGYTNNGIPEAELFENVEYVA